MSLSPANKNVIISTILYLQNKIGPPNGILPKDLVKLSITPIASCCLINLDFSLSAISTKVGTKNGHFLKKEKKL